MPDEEVSHESIRELATEFSTSIMILRTRWASYAQAVHPELSGSGLKVLQVISRRGVATSTDVCQALDMDKSAVSRQVSLLRELGIITVAPSAADKRVTHLTISPSGERALAEMRERSTADYSARLSGWSAAEVSQFTRLLHRFNESPHGAAGTDQSSETLPR